MGDHLFTSNRQLAANFRRLSAQPCVQALRDLRCFSDLTWALLSLFKPLGPDSTSGLAMLWKPGRETQHSTLGFGGPRPPFPIPVGSGLPCPSCGALAMPTFQGLNFVGLHLPSAH